MRRLLPLIAAFAVLLTFWSGTAAHASESIGPAMIESGSHFEGDRDQVPADDHKSVPHHHGICHADHVGLPAGSAPAGTGTQEEVPLRTSTAPNLPSTEPGASLRPPIA